MGIGSWFGFGDKSARASEPPPEPAHKVPTSQDLLDAVDRVEQQAKDGKAPGMVQSRLGRVARTVRDTVPAPRHPRVRQPAGVQRHGDRHQLPP